MYRRYVLVNRRYTILCYADSSYRYRGSTLLAGLVIHSPLKPVAAPMLVLFAACLSSPKVKHSAPASQSSGVRPSPQPPEGCAPALGNCYQSRCCMPSKGVLHGCYLKRDSKYAQCRPVRAMCKDSSDWLCPGWSAVGSNRTQLSRPTRIVNASSMLGYPAMPHAVPAYIDAALPKRPRMPLAKAGTAGSLQKGEVLPNGASPNPNAGDVSQDTTDTAGRPSAVKSSFTIPTTGNRTEISIGAIVLAVLSVLFVFSPLIRRKLNI